MRNNYSKDQIHLAARLYYVDGMGQNEVAKFVKVSQAKVSRLLAMARERGIVRITVADYEPRDKELETRLCVQLGLSEAIVIKAPSGLPGADLRTAIGLFASAPVEASIQPDDIIAIAGGRTIHALIKNIPESKNKNPVIVQSMGSVDSNISSFDSQEIGRALAQRLGGTFLAMNTPAYVSDKEMRDAFLSLDQVRVVQQNLDRADIAIIGIGTLANSVFIERGVFKQDDIAGLAAAGAVGEVCGRFYDASGKECDTSWSECVLSIELKQLAKIPRVIAVVSGSDRAVPIIAAIKGGFLKGLVIDEPGARALLETASQSPKPKPKKAKK